MISDVSVELDGSNSDAIRPSESFDYYTGTIYWNNFEVIRSHFNRSISGNEHVDWPHYLKARFGEFKRSFFINCGNGWVERDLFKAGVVNEVIGVDFSARTIAEAIEEARKINMPAKYSVGDCNKLSSTSLTVDLVVNHAAMHHVAYINRLTRHIVGMLNPNGRYVAFDYVGAHRNQYSWEMWSAMIEFNLMLPDRYRANLVYPHMKTMLCHDPTEAIHSELQLDVMHRYFDVEEYVALGGPIAYHLLFENKRLFDERHTSEGSATLERIVEADKQFVTAHPDSNLFAFWIARPKLDAFPDSKTIDQWQLEEDHRETLAAKNGGRYYPANALEMIYDELAELRYKLSLTTNQFRRFMNQIKRLFASMRTLRGRRRSRQCPGVRSRNAGRLPRL